jgi:hypothetical protein
MQIYLITFTKKDSLFKRLAFITYKDSNELGGFCHFYNKKYAILMDWQEVLVAIKATDSEVSEGNVVQWLPKRFSGSQNQSMG